MKKNDQVLRLLGSGAKPVERSFAMDQRSPQSSLTARIEESADRQLRM